MDGTQKWNKEIWSSWKIRGIYTEIIQNLKFYLAKRTGIAESLNQQNSCLRSTCRRVQQRRRRCRLVGMGLLIQSTSFPSAAQTLDGTMAVWSELYALGYLADGTVPAVRELNEERRSVERAEILHTVDVHLWLFINVITHFLILVLNLNVRVTIISSGGSTHKSQGSRKTFSHKWTH